MDRMDGIYMKKIKVFYKNVFYAIKYIYKIDKSYIFLEFLNVILTAFSSIFSVYSLKVLLDVFLQKKINVLNHMLRATWQVEMSG